MFGSMWGMWLPVDVVDVVVLESRREGGKAVGGGMAWCGIAGGDC